MRRISLIVLAGVALLGATVVLLNAATAGVSQPAMGVSAQLVSVAPSGLTAVPSSPLSRRPSGLKQTLAHVLATELFANPATRRPIVSARSPTITLPPPLSRGMACPVASGSSPGGCSIVPCAVYVGSGQTSYIVTSARVLGLAGLPSVTPKPSPGGRTPAGTCVSRPGRPPQLRWVSSAVR